MDGKLLSIAERLQTKLESLDPQQDRDTLIWAHGFLTGIVRHIQSAVPDLVTSKALLETVRANLDDVERMQLGGSGIGSDDRYSLDRIERELGGLDDAPVPAKPKRGPKDLIGGAALPLPDNERPM